MITASGHTLTVVAETGARFGDFSPYVAAVNDRGVVVFQAALVAGGTGVYGVHPGGVPRTILEAPGTAVAGAAASGAAAVARVRSHPDVDNAGNICFYADLMSGREAVVYADAGGVGIVADTNGPLHHVQPAGPTMNEGGKVGFRADLRDGHAGVFWGDCSATRCVADTRDAYAAFFGLPVVTAEGGLVFRADRRGGGQGIYRAVGHTVTAVVETGDTFGALALFPSVGARGEVAFVGMLRAGGGGVFLERGGRIVGLADTGDGFSSFRGALVGGGVVHYATPRGGELALYDGRDALRNRLFGLGDTLFGAAIVDLALNPVSINRAGQLAIRVRLADDRQLIVRADPP